MTDIASADVTVPSSEFNRRSILAAFAATVGLLAGFPSICAAPLGLYVIPLTHSFGIGRGLFGLLTALSLILCAALTPLVGRLLDRHGARPIVLPGVIALATVQFALSRMPETTPFLAILLLAQGIAGALLTTLAYVRVISLWFHRWRGSVLAVAAAVGSGGGAGISTVMTGIWMAQGGWRAAYQGTVIYLLLTLPILFLFLREPKQGETTGDSAPDPRHLVGLGMAEALASGPFRKLLVMVLTSIGALTVMMQHGPALLDARGLQIGSTYLAMCALGSMLGQLVSGFMLDRFDTPRVGLPFALCALTGGLVILHAGFHPAVILPAAFVMGLGQGAEIGLTAYYVTRYCGLKAYGAIFGLVVATVTVTAGITPMIAGYVFDATGSYDAFVPVIDVFLIASAIAITLLPAYRYAVRAEDVKVTH